MKTDAVAKSLLLDYYGDLLTEKQRTCFDLYYNQDLSLGEIGENEGVSRQGVHDLLARTEAILENFEAALGCVARARRQAAALEQLQQIADRLSALGQAESAIAGQIRSAVELLKE